jgi:hypothetical protein
MAVFPPTNYTLKKTAHLRSMCRILSVLTTVVIPRRLACKAHENEAHEHVPKTSSNVLSINMELVRYV